MNDEKIPINLFTLDMEEKADEPTVEELKNQKKHDCKPWKFLISICIVTCCIFIFINLQAPECLAVWMWVIVYLLLACLSLLSVIKINKIMKVN